MSDVLEVRPRADAQPAGAPIKLHPDAGQVIKDEPGTLIWVEQLADDTPAVVKMYRRRGPLAWQRARCGHGRAQREFDALRRLELAGVPCTPALFWAVGRSRGQGRFELLATRLLPDAVCLRDILRDEPGSRASLDLAPLFRDVARMHRCGIHHGALIPRNILVARADTVFHIMDLPRSVIFPRDLAVSRMGRHDLLDLCAGLLRYFQPEACAGWLSAYGLGDAAARALASEAVAFKSSKHLRNRRRAEFLLRAAFARAVR